MVTLNPISMKNKELSQSKSFKKSAIISIVATIVIVIAANILSSFWFARFDLTQDKRHSLSPSTVTLLKDLDDVVYIKVYIGGKDMPTSYQPVVTKTREMLEEFSSYTSKIKFEFIDPTEGKTKEEISAIYAEFAQKGLLPMPIREEYAAGQSTKYIIPGAIVTYKNKESVATLIEEDYSNKFTVEDYSYMRLEYNLRMALAGVLNTQKSSIAFIDGHGELNMYNTAWIGSQLGVNLQYYYNVTRDSINGRINSLRKIAVADTLQGTVKDLGNKYDVLIIAQPTRPYSDKDKYAIDQHIMRGGKVMWLIDGTNAAMDSLQYCPEFMALPAQLRLTDMFFKYGVRVNSNLIQDIGSCQALPIEQDKMMIFPYALNITHFEKHPITQRITSLRSNFAGTIDFVGKDDNLKKTVLATSSDSSKLVPTPAIVSLKVGLAKPNSQEFSSQRLPIAAVVEGKFQSVFDGILPIEFDTIKQFNFLRESKETKQIFIADGDIIRNFFDPRVGFRPTGFDVYTGKFYDNSEFITNCIDYLCGNTDLIELRSKTFKIGHLNNTQIADKTIRKKFQLINIALPLLVIGVIAITLLFIRRKKYNVYPHKNHYEK
jgi:ABC-2 type transport system permease protein